MIHNVNDNPTVTEKTSSERFERCGYVDIHCHCLPAVDDGPATMSESLALCRALVDDCATTVIATPHQLGRYSQCNEASQIREAVSALNKELKSNDISLAVMPGGDVRVDERICQLLETDKILTLADGGKYILLELPHQIFIDIEPLLVELASLGIQTIISHPERHPVLAKQHKMLLGPQTQCSALGFPVKWFNHPIHLQVTAASLLGEFGLGAQKAAWNFLSSGLASLVATDSHDLDGRIPRMRNAFECIRTKLGEAIANLVCIENPLRVLKGQDIVSVCSNKTIGVCQ